MKRPSYCQKVLIALYENGTPFEYRMLEQDGAMRELEAPWPLKRFPVAHRRNRGRVEGEGWSGGAEEDR